MNRLRVTLDDIAQTAGYSKATISSILKGGGTSARFSAATREKILNVVEKMNYQPLATHNLGFVYSTGPVDHTKVDWVGWISPMLTSAQEEAMVHDKILSIFCYSSLELGTQFHGGRTPAIFRRRKIDGLIVSGRLDERVVSHITDSRLPYVLMNISDADARSEDSLCFDELFTGMQATRYLLDKGHRRILHASVGWSLGHYSIPIRRRGYEQAMREAGCEPRTIRLAEEEYDAFAAQLGEIFQGPDRPTAIFTHAESVAIVCLQILQEMGINRSDAALVSTAWGPKTPLDLLKIPYVELPADEMGRLAVQMLTRKIATKQPNATISLRGRIKEPAAGRRDRFPL
jgi:DNA-binding LacI/PurR family transcriptional regulator